MQSSYGLLIESQGGSSRTAEFALPRVVIGREVGEILLPDTQISNGHAELLFDGRCLILRDLGSTNGSWVEGQRVTSLELRPGTSVHLGLHRITFMGLSGAPGRGRTVAVQQLPGPWNAAPAAVAHEPWRPPPPAAIRPAAPPSRRQRGLGIALLLVAFLGVAFVGVLGLGAVGLYLGARSSGEPGRGQLPPGGDAVVEATFGTRSFHATTIAASGGDDPRQNGRVVELHAASSPEALAARSELLSLGLRADRPGTYTVGPTAAALSLSLGEEEHFLARPGVSIELVRLDPGGGMEGTFAGDFEHEVSGKVVEIVPAKGSFRAKLP